MYERPTQSKEKKRPETNERSSTSEQSKARQVISNVASIDSSEEYSLLRSGNKPDPVARDSAPLPLLPVEFLSEPTVTTLPSPSPCGRVASTSGRVPLKRSLRSLEFLSEPLAFLHSLRNTATFARLASLVVLSRDLPSLTSERDVNLLRVKPDRSSKRGSRRSTSFNVPTNVYSLKDINKLTKRDSAGIATLKSSFLHSHPLQITYNRVTEVDSLSEPVRVTEVPLQVFNPLWGEPQLSIVRKRQGFLERYISYHITHIVIYYIRNEQLIQYLNVFVSVCATLLNVDPNQLLTDLLDSSVSNIIFDIDSLKSYFEPNDTIMLEEVRSSRLTGYESGNEVSVATREVMKPPTQEEDFMRALASESSSVASPQSTYGEREQSIGASEAFANERVVCERCSSELSNEVNVSGSSDITETTTSKRANSCSSLCCKSVTVIVIIGLAVLSLYNPESNVHVLVPT